MDPKMPGSYVEGQQELDGRPVPKLSLAPK